MVQVLDPFEVGDGDTTGVHVEVGQDHDVALEELLVGIGGGRSVGTLGDDLGLDLVDVLGGDLALESGGHEDVALEAHNLGGGHVLGLGVALEATVLLPVGQEVFAVETVGVVEGGVDFNQTDDLGSLSLEEFEGVVADVAESLDDEGLASNAGFAETAGLAVLLRGKEVLHTVEETLQGLNKKCIRLLSKGKCEFK